jgi:3-oxoadipate enol-lactonase
LTSASAKPGNAAGDRGRVVFLHSDVGDARMWATQQALLHDRFETVALDLHEAGMAPGEFSFVELVGQQLPAILVGNSFGGRVALETALAFPDRVPRLVLADPAIGDHHWGQDMRDYLRREERLLAAGDIDAAVELNLERWALPHIRDILRPMQRRALELDAAREGDLVWPQPRPLSALTMPVLVIVGERDTEDLHAIAHRIAREAPSARLEVIAHASHHPSLEQPEAFNRLLLQFLGG